MNRSRTSLSGASAWLIALAFPILSMPPASAQDEDLAKQLANPVAALISVPFQLNFDRHIGPADEGERLTLNIQPVVPIDISENYNLISRTIVPIVSQSDITPGIGSQSGIGDIVQSFFFSPKAPGPGGWIMGYGPALLVPSGTDDLLTTDKWGLGPTFVALKQSGPWTYGALVNHIASVAGDDSRADISLTFIQPFLSYTTPTAYSFSVSTEATYDWENEQVSVPLSVSVSKIISFGDQKASIGGALRNWVNGPDSGPEDWALRFSFTLLFPTG